VAREPDVVVIMQCCHDGEFPETGFKKCRNLLFFKGSDRDKLFKSTPYDSLSRRVEGVDSDQKQSKQSDEQDQQQYFGSNRIAKIFHPGKLPAKITISISVLSLHPVL
jgi:hypothetical protein